MHREVDWSWYQCLGAHRYDAGKEEEDDDVDDEDEDDCDEEEEEEDKDDNHPFLLMFHFSLYTISIHRYLYINLIFSIVISRW